MGAEAQAIKCDGAWNLVRRNRAAARRRRTTFVYDTIPSQCPAKEQHGIGRLSAMHDAWGSTWYCYDRFGNVARKVQQREMQAWEVSYTHDLASRLVEISYPAGGPSVQYERDLVGRIIAVNVGKDALVSGAEYLPYGPLERIAFGHGDELVRHYDQNAWSTGVQSPALALGYRLDDVGNIVALGTSPGAPQATETYDYDGLYRLTGVRAPDAALREGYTYDATGNRIAHTVAQQSVDYAYAANSHRLMAVGGEARGYDANGNTTSIGSQTFVYGDHNRLVEATHASGATASEYNGRGERVRHGLSNYVYDEAGRVLLAEEEIDSCPWCDEEDAPPVPANHQWLVWMDDTPVGVATDEALYAVHADQFDTPRAVTTRTVPAQARWHWSYESNPFGAAAANEDSDGDGTLLAYPLRFPGQVAVADTGLHYNYFREYEPGTGRFIESDPIGLVGGVSTYSYVMSNPLRFFDADGLRARVCCKKIRGIGWLGVRHCYIERDNPRRIWGLFGDTRGPGSSSGSVSTNDDFDTGGDCGSWNETCGVDECVEEAASSYPDPSVYRFAAGPNSNTFAGTIARKCELSNEGIGGTSPGYNDPPAPPLNR